MLNVVNGNVIIGNVGPFSGFFLYYLHYFIINIYNMLMCNAGPVRSTQQPAPRNDEQLAPSYQPYSPS